MPGSIDVRSSLFGRNGCYTLAISRHNNLINQTVRPRVIWCHEAVALGIFSNFGFGLAGMAYQDIVEHISHTQNLTGVNFNLGRLPLDAPERLMNHNSGMRQRKTRRSLAQTSQNHQGC